MKKIRILVTGAGSTVGQGIIKSLRLANLPLHIIASDISPLNCALYRADDGIILPKAEESGALAKTIEALKHYAIDVVFIGSEYDVIFFSNNQSTIEEETGALIISSAPEAARISADKWETSEFLRLNNLSHPTTYRPESLDEAKSIASTFGYPFILKQRFGTSNKHVYVIKNEKQLDAFYQITPDPIIQELLRGAASTLGYEYTCSVFRCQDGTILQPFTARRTLHGSNSWVVEVDEFQELYGLLTKVADLLKINSTINIQLMLTECGPVPFEFNCRFSGTTPIRAHFGFNEPEMAIRSYYLGEAISPPVLKKGMAFRYVDEIYLDGFLVNDLKQPFPKGGISSLL